MQLVELRDAWNRIDGFVVNWNSDTQFKYIIDIYNEQPRFMYVYKTQKILYFGSEKTRGSFYATFRNLIKTAKELL